MEEILKKVLEHITAVARDFLELLQAPRAYGKKGKLFDSSRLGDALLFLAVSVFITVLLRAPRELVTSQIYPGLARDALWKFASVVLEAAVISTIWRSLKGRGQVINYVVANCFYFGLVTVFGRTGLLIVRSVDPSWDWRNTTIVSHPTAWTLGIAIGSGVAVWACRSWLAYADYNKVTGRRAWLVLIAVLVGSMPVLGVVWVLRRALGFN